MPKFIRLPQICRRLALFPLLLSSTPIWAAAANPPSGLLTGQFGDWIAATHTTGTGTECYAFTRAPHEGPPATLWLTGGTLMIETGFPAAPNTAMTAQAGDVRLGFYTLTHQAFPDQADAALDTLRTGGATELVARVPRRDGTLIPESFSLNGFAAAMAAVTRTCPEAAQIHVIAPQVQAVAPAAPGTVPLPSETIPPVETPSAAYAPALLPVPPEFDCRHAGRVLSASIHCGVDQGPNIRRTRPIGQASATAHGAAHTPKTPVPIGQAASSAAGRR